MQNRTNDAIDKYQRVVELDPDNEDAGLRLTGQLLLARKPMEGSPSGASAEGPAGRPARPDADRPVPHRLRPGGGSQENPRRCAGQYPHFPEALRTRLPGPQQRRPGGGGGLAAGRRGPRPRGPGGPLSPLPVPDGPRQKGREADDREGRLDEMEADLQELYGELIGQDAAGALRPGANRAGEIALRARRRGGRAGWPEHAEDRPSLHRPRMEHWRGAYRSDRRSRPAARHGQAGP